MYSMLSMGSLSSALANHPVIPVDPFLEPRTSNLYTSLHQPEAPVKKKQQPRNVSQHQVIHSRPPLILVQIPFNYQYTPTPHPDLKPEAYSPLTNSPHAYSTNLLHDRSTRPLRHPTSIYSMIDLCGSLVSICSILHKLSTEQPEGSKCDELPPN